MIFVSGHSLQGGHPTVNGGEMIGYKIDSVQHVLCVHLFYT